ncbi:MAG: hypothetical protein AAGM46_27905 [Cyanobacteria bacterium J06582_2]
MASTSGENIDSEENISSESNNGDDSGSSTKDELDSGDDTDTDVKNTSSSSIHVKPNIDQMDEVEMPPKLTRQFAGIYAKPILNSIDASTSCQESENRETDTDEN